VARAEKPYFFASHIFVEACQTPPAFTQSAWLSIFESDEGLAEGDVEEPDDGGVDIDPLPEDPVLEPELVAPPLLPAPAPVVVPPLVACAATSAGAKQMIPINTRENIFLIRFPPCARCRSVTGRHVATIDGLQMSRQRSRANTFDTVTRCQGKSLDKLPEKIFGQYAPAHSPRRFCATRSAPGVQHLGHWLDH